MRPNYPKTQFLWCPFYSNFQICSCSYRCLVTSLTINHHLPWLWLWTCDASCYNIHFAYSKFKLTKKRSKFSQHSTPNIWVLIVRILWSFSCEVWSVVIWGHSMPEADPSMLEWRAAHHSWTWALLRLIILSYNNSNGVAGWYPSCNNTHAFPLSTHVLTFK